MGLSNHGPISYHFQDSRRFQLKIANFPTYPRVLNTPPEGISPGIGYRRLASKTRMMGYRAEKEIWRHLQPSGYNTSTPSISQPLPVNCSTTPSQHVWSSGFLRRGSDGMELASRLSPGPCSEYWQFQIGFKDTSLRSAAGRLAHYRHCMMRYINTRLLLLLLLLLPSSIIWYLCHRQ